MPFELFETILPAVSAAGGTTTFILGEFPRNESEGSYTLESVSVTAPSLVTGATATAGTFNIRRLRAGVVETAVCGTLALVTGVNLAAETETNIPLTVTTGYLPGDVLDVQYVQISTGLALPVGTHLQAEFD